MERRNPFSDLCEKNSLKLPPQNSYTYIFNWKWSDARSVGKEFPTEPGWNENDGQDIYNVQTTKLGNSSSVL